MGEVACRGGSPPPTSSHEKPSGMGEVCHAGIACNAPRARLPSGCAPLSLKLDSSNGELHGAVGHCYLMLSQHYTWYGTSPREWITYHGKHRLRSVQQG